MVNDRNRAFLERGFFIGRDKELKIAAQKRPLWLLQPPERQLFPKRHIILLGII
jgi:hypothetical protein